MGATRAARMGSSFILLLGTLVTLIGAWPIRDHELVVRVTEVGQEEPIRLYQEKIFCTILPDCFRITNKAIMSVSRIVIDPVTSWLSAFPGNSTTLVPAIAPQYARNLGPYLMVRVVALLLIAYALRSFFRRWFTVAVVTNLLLWWSTGVPIRALARAYGELLQFFGNENLGPTLFYHFSMNSTIFLLEYDYLALAALLCFPMLLSHERVHDGVWRPIVLGSGLALTFEHLAIVYGVAIVWLLLRKKLKSSVKSSITSVVLIALGWAVPIVSMIIYSRISNPNSGVPLVKITQLGFRINREGEHEWIILRFVFGFLVVPYLLGRILGVIVRSLGLLRNAAENLRPYIHAVVLGLCLSYLVGFFHSALITEFGRQTIAAQVLLFVSGVLKNSSLSRHDAVGVTAAR